jgi:hypothetical protein
MDPPVFSPGVGWLASDQEKAREAGWMLVQHADGRIAIVSSVDGLTNDQARAYVAQEVAGASDLPDHLTDDARDACLKAHEIVTGLYGMALA